MGYAVYITRAPHHLDGPQTPIPQEDWRTVIENDPDLESRGGSPNLARWAGPSSLETPCIDWANGNLFSRDPDHSVIRKLIDIAGLLGGRVQGERGELYSVERGQVTCAEPDVREESPPEAPKPFLGVQPVPSEPEAGMDVEELEAALGALANHHAATLDPVDDDPHASFARAPEDALGTDPASTPPSPVTFTVGQRVRTPWGRPGTIVAIDPDADWGMGRIDIKYDDGRTATTSCITHGLELM